MPDYDADFYGWANEQAALLRAGRLGDADIANIAEEIESMGRSEKRELVRRLECILTHLLRWTVQVQFRSRQWELEIEEERFRLACFLSESPSLETIIEDSAVEAFCTALRSAQRVTGLDESHFDIMQPWPVAAIRDEGFYPE